MTIDMMIADLPANDRPRERLQKHGARTLSDADLLAILLGSGTEGKNAIWLAREMLHGGGLSLLGQRDIEQLTKTNGVGPAKAARIAAAFELGRRYATADEEEMPIFDEKALANRMMLRARSFKQEHLGGLFLDARRRILREKEIYVGTIERACVSTRDVLRLALDINAVNVVLYHNHPSGDPLPSEEDHTFTKRMSEILELANMHLLDHLIFGRRAYVSMKGKSYY